MISIINLRLSAIEDSGTDLELTHHLLLVSYPYFLP